MHIQEYVRRSGRKGHHVSRRLLVEWGFDLRLFKCEEEIQFATHYIEDHIIESVEFELLKRFGVTPAWIIGDNGPFVGEDGMKKLIQAFELGQHLNINTSNWLVHHTSVEVIKMLPKLYN